MKESVVSFFLSFLGLCTEGDLAERAATAVSAAPPTTSTSSKAAASAPASAPEGASYTCPMHPEILRDAPGDCPKCGMHLEPKRGSSQSTETGAHSHHTEAR